MLLEKLKYLENRLSSILQLAWAQVSHQISIRLGEDPPRQGQGGRKGGEAAVLMIGGHHLQLEASLPHAPPAQASPAHTRDASLDV